MQEITGYKTYTDGDYSVRFPVSGIDYYEGGTKTVREYNENEELISESKYDAEGNLI